MADKEYIERGELLHQMRLQANRSSLGEFSPPYLSYGEALTLVHEAPAADVVEVVRCKDCVCGRHPNKSDRFEALYPAEYLYCSVHESGVKREDYEAVIAGQETLQKYIAKIKAEVAREIFEEVQKTLIFGADRMRIAELKKKYTVATDTNDGHKAGE